MESGTNESETLRESLKRGLADSLAGRVSDLGSFIRYAEGDAKVTLRYYRGVLTDLPVDAGHPDEVDPAKD